MFKKQIDRRNVNAMQKYLKEHFRYDTMNSWNRATSYANCIKLHKLEKPVDVDDGVWWELFTLPQWNEVLSDMLDEFGRDHNWLWQAGINGRSGGYVVLYQGGIKPSGYQSYCTHCGQKNYQPVPEGQIGYCGKCEAKARINYKQTHIQVFTWPGKGVDMDEDFQDWTKDQLCSRVELVQDFDRLCSRIVEVYVNMCKNNRIVSQEILVPETVKVLEPVGGQ